VKITADTNVLLRLIVADDPKQASAAVKALTLAETVAVSLTALCELSWVLQGSYGVARSDIAAPIGGSSKLKKSRSIVPLSKRDWQC